MAGTSIRITPPGGTAEEVTVYSRCMVSMGRGRVGSFIIELPASELATIERYVIGSDVRIQQDDHIFRGWLLNPARSQEGPIKYITLDGLCYTGKTQRIVVSEAYDDMTISDIVKDLFEKYMPGLNTDNVVDSNKVISIRFRDEFLYECMDKLAQIAGYQWGIAEPTPELLDQGVDRRGWGEVVSLVPPIQNTEFAGWGEQITTLQTACPIPSEALYPSETLFPC